MSTLPSRYLKTGAAGVWLAAALATAQTVQIDAPRRYVLAARTLDLTASANTPSGAALSSFRPSWRSLNADIASVDAAGRVTGRLPGVAVIEAAQGGLAGRVRLLVYPAGVTLKPDSPVLELGAQATLTATALDADGKALAARFDWYTSASNIVSITRAGAAKGEGAGSADVTAVLSGMPPEYDFSTQTVVTVRPRADYSVKRLLTGGTIARPVTVKTMTDIGYSGGERMVFSATLSNGAQALLSYYRGRVEIVASTGQWLEDARNGIGQIRPASINEKGDVLSSVDVVNSGTWMSLVKDGKTISSSANTSNSLTSLNNRGEQAYKQWTGSNWSVFRRSADGTVRKLLDPSGDANGFGRLNWIPDPYIGANGQILINIYPVDGNRAAAVWDGSSLKKIWTWGEPIAGTTGLWNDEPRLSVDGDVFFRFGGNGFWAMARWSKGAWAIPARFVDGGLWNDGAYDFRDDTFLYRGVEFGPDKTQRYLCRVKNGVVEKLLRYGPTDEWRSIDQAMIWSDGSVVARGSTKDSPSRIVRISGGAVTTLLQSGATLDVPAVNALAWNDLPRGNTAQAPLFRTPSSAVARLRAGTVEIVAGPGDTLAASPLLWTSGFATNRTGDVAVVGFNTDNRSLHVVRGGVPETILDAARNPSVAGRRINNLGAPLALNNRGQLVAMAYTNRWEVLYVPGQGADMQFPTGVNSPAPESGIFTGFSQHAIDESGRAAMVASTSNASPGLFLFENGKLSRIAAAGQNGSQGVPIRDFSNLQAAGNKIYATLFYCCGTPEEIVEVSASGWRPLVRDSENSLGLNFWGYSGGGHFAANTAGDILYVGAGPEGRFLIVRRKDGKDTIVASTRGRLANGDWITEFVDWTISDQGDVFFTALTPDGLRDSTVLYQATAR